MKIDELVMTFFNREIGHTHMNSIHIHKPGISKQIKNYFDYRSDRVIHGIYTASPFRSVIVGELPQKMPRLDQLCLF